MFFLKKSFITPQSLAYDRNHSSRIPQIQANTNHLVHIDGQVSNPYSVSVEQLATEFAQHEVTCALTCAGNRRHTMRTMLKEVEGIDWGDGAIMNCTWRGPRVRDVLERAGISCRSVTGHGGLNEDGYGIGNGNGNGEFQQYQQSQGLGSGSGSADQDSSGGLEGKQGQDEGGKKNIYMNMKKLHACFSSYQVRCQDDSWFGGSVELGRCMDLNGDVILGLEVCINYGWR